MSVNCTEPHLLLVLAFRHPHTHPTDQTNHHQQVLAGTFGVDPSASLAPSLAALAAASLWLSGPAKQSVEAFQKAVALLPGWCATCMFALMPLPQLVRLFAFV